MICPKIGKQCNCDKMGWVTCFPDPRLTITADEFAAMARDAERYRRIRDGDHPLPANFSSLAFHEMDAAIDAAMAERNKEKS